MTYPTKYSRQYDFKSYQNSNPTRPLPADKVNADLDSAKISINEIVDFLKGFSRADGKLANNSVGVNQLDPSVRIGFSAPTTWEPQVAYSVGDTVFYGNKFYISKITHSSTDGFDESKWNEIVDFGAEADAAAASASAAAGSASTASTKADDASASAGDASGYASAASGSASDASGSAAAASGSASAAAGSASSASGSAAAASGSASEASASATAASGYATAASGYADAAAGAVAGKMDKSSYDPTNVGSDAFNSTNTKFTPTGTGAVQTTVSAKLRERKSLSDFNPVGDGVSSDATVIQNALNAADQGAGNSLVVLPPQTEYFINSIVTVSGDYPVDFRGQGQPEFNSNVNGPAFSLGDDSTLHQGFVSFRDMKIWGRTGSAIGLKARYLANLNLEGLSLYELGLIGFDIGDCYTFRMDRTQVNSCGTGAYISGAAMNGATITRSKFIGHTGTNKAGVSIDGDDGSEGKRHYGGLIQGCDFESNNWGIYLSYVSGLRIDSCYFENNTNHIITYSGAQNLTLSNIEAIGTGTIELNGVTNLVLENIALYGSGEKLVLNSCTGVRAHGLLFPGGGTITVNGSTMSVADFYTWCATS